MNRFLMLDVRPAQGLRNACARMSAGLLLASLAAATVAAPRGACAQVAAPGSAPIVPQATIPLTPYTGPRYDDRFEWYGGMLFMNDIAGQDFHQHYSMGGGETMGTYWFGAPKTVKRWGVSADYRFGAGTAQVSPNAENNDVLHFNRILVMQNVVTAGVSYRWLHNRYAGLELHLMDGESHGDFNYALTHYPDQAKLYIADCPAHIDSSHPTSTGFYCNHWAPYALAGGSVDFNTWSKVAIRLQPDLVVNHWGAGTREFFSVSLGAVYRFGETRPKLQ